MSEIGNIITILSSAMGDYLSRRTDDFKKVIIAGLAAGFSRVLAVLVITMLLLIVLAVFAFAFIVLLGDLIGSLSGAAFIVGGVYLVCAMIFFIFRKRLFLNMFTNLFTGIAEASSPTDSWKPLLMTLVRNLRIILSSAPQQDR